VVEIIGGAGFDFVIPDEEHGAIGPERMEEMIRAADTLDVPSLVRIADNRPVTIASALDRGAHGVVVPHVSSAQAAEQVVDAAKFAPVGERGLNPSVRAGDYFRVPIEEFCERSNDAVVLVLQVEGREGLENVEPIAAVPGFDVIFVGPFDLSQSLGVLGQIHHPTVIDAVRQSVEVAGRHGKVVGTFVGSAEDANFWAQHGVSVLFYQADTVLFSSACDATYAELKQLREIDG
jgi:4-hydroxy-2-oxoheptanedioate aldolase